MFSCFFVSQTFALNDINADKYTTDTRREKKYLDLFVWDSTIAMSEGENGNSNVVTTGAQNSPPHLLQRCLPL